MEADETFLPEFVLIASPSRPHPRTKEIKPSLYDAWRKAIQAIPQPVASRFTIKEENFDAAALARDLGPIDCLVSPANAFGIMDGGCVLSLHFLLLD